MGIHRLVHLSDLHLRSDPAWIERVAALVRYIDEADADHVVISGDVTHRGKRAELGLFRELFGPLHARRRLTVVPGNHDCNGDDIRALLMDGPRIMVDRAEGLYLVRIDSTCRKNRSRIDGRGTVSRQDIALVRDALSHCPRHELPVVLLHHHLLPLPDDKLHEQIAAWLGVRYTAELELGRELLSGVHGRCPLVLHGHRHLPAEQEVFADTRSPIGLFNAGSSPTLGAARLFIHSMGELVTSPQWIGRPQGDRLSALGPLLTDFPSAA